MTTNVLLDSDNDTIVALCTAQGSGAIALIRLSGQHAIDLVSSIAKLSSGKLLDSYPTHTIHHGFVVAPDTQTTIDEVLFFLMHAPKTFTGQHTVEISCHNNPFIIESIIACCIKQGARQAQPGEFSKRAYLNGKMDLLQAESLKEMLGAQTQLALKKSLSQLQGSFSSYVKKLETRLFKLLCHVESSFEFLEEEQRDLDFDAHIKQQIDSLINSIATTKNLFNAQQQIKQGIRIALIGSVNTGKSTLFNALVKKNRAIVTKQPGTTRDCIEYSLYKDGNFWLVIDTAGLRETENVIEQEGINRSYQEATEADVVLLVIDSSQELSAHEIEIYKKIYSDHGHKIITVLNKIDCPHKQDLPGFLVKTSYVQLSAKNAVGIDLLESAIHKRIQNLFATLDSPFLLNQRQYNLICQIQIKLKTIEKSFSDALHYELIAYHLKDMLEKVSELTGKNISEGVLDTVFKTFCIGK